MPHRATALLAALATLILLVGATTSASATALLSASDSFTRTVANGLGTADSGGAWTLAGTASRFAVAGGTATVSTPAGAQYSGYLGSVGVRDTDVSATLGVRSLPVGGSMYVGVLARHSATTDYTGRLVVSATGAVTIGLLAGATSLKSVAVAGLTVTPTTTVRIRLQTIGANPTTVQARVWKLGTAEPTTWQVSTTDSTAGLQVGGSVGIRTYLSSGATNGPIVGTVDDLAAASTTPVNVPPVAAFTATPSGLSTAFDGSASTDPDGTIVSSAWSFGDGGVASGVTATHAYAAAGTYTVTLTVTDNGGATGSTTRTVTVAAPNSPPVAAFTTTSAGLAVTADASGSTDPDGTIASSAWSFGDGGVASGVTATHTYAAAGTYVVTLTVTDNQGATGTTSQSVVVSAPTAPVPVASFTVTASGLSVAVDGSGSTDVGGTINAYAWTFGDGGTASGATATHTFAAGGTYAVTLVVTDAGGATGSAQQSAIVAPVDQPPVPSLLEQQTGLSATFFGDASSDPDGTVTAYAWTFGDGTSSTVSDPSHTYAAAGSYLVALTVTDNAGATSTTTRSVTVFASGVKPTQVQWLTDAGNALSGATGVLDAQETVSKPAIVLDIDNTSLQSYYQPFVATTPVLAFEQRAVDDGYAVLFATGRTADTGGTLKQLTSAGYHVDSLCFKDPSASTQASKIACRAGWAAQGYTIVANVGNHTTDLVGGNSGRQYLLPNYNFLD